MRGTPEWRPRRGTPGPSLGTFIAPTEPERDKSPIFAKEDCSGAPNFPFRSFRYTREGREWAGEVGDRRLVLPWMTHLNSRSRSSGRERRANSAATTAPLRAIQLVMVMLSTDMAWLLSTKRLSKALSSVPRCNRHRWGRILAGSRRLDGRSGRRMDVRSQQPAPAKPYCVRRTTRWFREIRGSLPQPIAAAG